MSSEQTKKEREEQDKKFSYKAPESVYQNRNNPKSSATAKGQAFTGVNPMSFYMQQNAAKKAEKQKEHETKVGTYKNNMFKGAF